MADIEAQTLRRDKRALLGDVTAKVAACRHINAAAERARGGQATPLLAAASAVVPWPLLRLLARADTAPLPLPYSTPARTCAAQGQAYRQ